MKKMTKYYYQAACPFAILFSIAMIFGWELEQNGSVAYHKGGLWLLIVLLSVVTTIITAKLFSLLDIYRLHKQQKVDQTSQEGEITDKRYFFILWLVFFLCFVPTFLAVFPGFFVYDAQDEYLQVATRTFTDHHPMIHVLILGGILRLFDKLTGSINTGIAVYTICQMIAMSAIFSYVILFLRRNRISKWIRNISILYFALFPVIHMYVLCSSKDTPFTAALLLYLVCVLDMIFDEEAFFSSKAKCILLFASMLGSILFRHNGFYVILLMIPVMFFVWKRHRKIIVFVSALMFVAYALYTGPFYRVFNVSTSENQEMLSVPIQQLTRAYTIKPSSFTEEEKQILYAYLPKEALERYKPKLADPVKISFDNEVYDDNAADFWKLWLTILKKEPAIYVDSFLLGNYGYWYPPAILDGYKGNHANTFVYGDSSYFGFETEPPGTRESKIPFLNEWYRSLSLEISFQKIPVISLLFAPAFYFWVCIFAFGYQIVRKNLKGIILLAPMILLWLTVMLGPVALVRYVLIFYFGMPLLLVTLFELCYTTLDKE